MSGARPQRTEAQVEHACDRLVREQRGKVITLGRHSITQNPGLPSRRYHVHGSPLWWASRSDRGRLSHTVSELLIVEYSMGQIVGAGDEQALRHVLRYLSQGDVTVAREIAWQCFRTIAERGLVGRAS